MQNGMAQSLIQEVRGTIEAMDFVVKAMSFQEISHPADQKSFVIVSLPRGKSLVVGHGRSPHNQHESYYDAEQRP